MEPVGDRTKQKKMKKSERAKVLKEINLPPTFTKFQDTAYYIVQERNLKIMVGIMVDSTSNPKDFVINSFITPLFIEFPAFVLTIGDRIGSSWYPEELPIINDELRNIITYNSILEIFKYVREKYSMTNKYVLKTLGYICLIKGNNPRALEYFEYIVELAKESPFEWFQKEGVLIQHLIDKIKNNQNDEIFRELEAAQIRMVTNLKLDPTILTQ
jgi:hypothetical protein